MQALDEHGYKLSVDEEPAMLGDEHTHRASDSRETFTTMTTTIDLPPAPSSRAEVIANPDLIEAEVRAHRAARGDGSTDDARAHLEQITQQAQIDKSQRRQAARAPRSVGDLAAALIPGGAFKLAQAQAQLDDPERAAKIEAQIAAEDEEERRSRSRSAKQAQAEEKDRQARYATYAAQRDARSGALADLDLRKLHPQQDPDQLVTTWLACGANSLILSSAASGVGKTASAFALCNKIAADDRAGRGAPRSVQAWRASDLMAELLPLTGPAKTAEALARQAGIVEGVETCNYLLLDDMTAVAKGEGWAWREFVVALSTILENRNGHPSRRTVYTLQSKDRGSKVDERGAVIRVDGRTVPTGQGPKETMIALYGTAVWSRMKHDARPVWIAGQDLRPMHKEGQVRVEPGELEF
jgi:DNA replication protein DnaC